MPLLRVFQSLCSLHRLPGGVSLGDTGAADAGGAHLCQDFVQPLQGAVEVQLDPAGSAGHSLPPARGKREHRTPV